VHDHDELVRDAEMERVTFFSSQPEAATRAMRNHKCMPVAFRETQTISGNAVNRPYSRKSAMTLRWVFCQKPNVR